MKIVSLLLCLASVALAEDPAELVKLRQIWKNSVAEATKSAEETYRSKNIKANKLYYIELNEMKKNFMTAQNLNGANAVDAEIKRLEVSHKELKFSPPRKPNKPQEKASPLDGVWIERVIGGSTHVKIIKEGQMIGSNRRKAKLTITKDILMIDRVDGFSWKLKIDPKNPNIMKGSISIGYKVIWERYKW
jgi:hypothetical protein